jgi:hypothetical protein
MKRLLKRGVLGITKRSSLVTDVAAYITRHTSVQAAPARDSYGFFRERFIANGKKHALNEAQQERLVHKFERIARTEESGASFHKY